MKPSSFFVATAGSAALLALALIAAPSARLAAAAATPPPTPPPIAQPATPPPPLGTPGTPGPAASVFTLPAATPAPAGKATPTPPPDARKGLDGVWEVQIQHANGTDYTHFQVKQQGDSLAGTYLDTAGKKYPLSGSIDGAAVRMIVTMPNGTTILLEGKLDGTTDMVGMLTTPQGQTAFTAAYRAKGKWIDNINPSPGGIPQPGSYTPP
ncbi:MAG: hypothetical protein JOZ77_00815 [Candidatus Eremiobacteraeota bacterium]|nr:hypothetical protein [Candidatus Eremiobacteraeota bacterium]